VVRLWCCRFRGGFIGVAAGDNRSHQAGIQLTGMTSRRGLSETVAEASVFDSPTVDAESQELPRSISGVEVRRLTMHADHRGVLTPAIDTRDRLWSEPIVYAYCITILPGRIKGWGMHERQTDRYVTVNGNVRVVLFDGRSGSATEELITEIYFTDRTPGVVQIPPGVWHATQNWGDTEARIMNFPTRAYDPCCPDKSRVDPHSGAIPFDWSLRDG
jgi:dTDP-4-dehydrorhamnose 3,5-epimerase